MSESYDTIEKRLSDLKAVEDSVLSLAMDCLNAYEGKLYPLDFLASAAAKRTLAQISGFRSMIQERNLICAGAIIRLQLDTALRFFASYIVKDPHGFASEVLKGVQIRNLKDRNGKRMTDAYLVEQLAAESGDYDWVTRVYRETSGYVHFSSKHVFSIFTGERTDDGAYSVEIGAKDIDLPKEVYFEAIEAFVASIAIFMTYLRGWGISKKNPEAIAELRANGEK